MKMYWQERVLSIAEADGLLLSEEPALRARALVRRLVKASQLSFFRVSGPVWHMAFASAPHHRYGGIIFFGPHEEIPGV